jgi:hypothetical protein
MKLNSTIIINPPPVTDPNTNKLLNPPPLVLSELNVIYHDNPTMKTVTATIQNIPGQIILLKDREYEEAADYTQSFIEDKLRVQLGPDPAQKLRSMFPKTLEEHPNGAGTILSGMIASLGIKSTSNCACRKHAIEMNENGNDWCEANMNEILGWLKEESNKRGLPFIEAIAKIMVAKSIKKSRRLLEKETSNAI